MTFHDYKCKFYDTILVNISQYYK